METSARGQPLLGVLLKVISTIAFTAMATLIKYVSDRYPAGEVAFFRSAFALIPVLVWVGYKGLLTTVFVTPRIGGHLLRSVAGATSMFFGFSALARLPLSDATAIGYASPLMTVVLAAFLLKETIRVYRWTAVVIGLCGVLVILSGYVGASNEPDRSAIGAIFSLLAAFFGALAATQTRRLTWVEQPGTIVIYFSLFTALFMLITTLPFGWVMPHAEDWPFLIGCGVFGGIGQVLLTQSYRFGDASLIAPFEYISMVWAIIVGYFLFANVPSGSMLLGSGIVIASGLFVIYREHRLGLRRERERAAKTPTVTGA
ncbi:DMT family transporter [Kaistia dalseonensis]|uniref:Drug/metabolite transporter (DMT)-like permease n=1 Tax=Kaistia dalseonensis TaxID=410840 RepID=A0ABU0H1B5_9HYPH|nr:DMT family transporter [Kaistia dalseonensis]MCX5493540.1 DMT family transporter [Kaistia dalseonensis]MDQ0436100.1 drug/metabolite transporter (DMT)-like permease [Kaistia dalseonensis]